MKKRYALLAMLAVLAIWACRKPYNPPAIASPVSYLVVEGQITGNSDSSFITLSRTVNIAAINAANPELHATVAVESDQQVNYPLTELGNGVYACGALNLNNTHQYRLTITTANGQMFVSDYVGVVNSPPIDSISVDTKGSVQGAGLNVYVNTHDPTNTIKYFRWDYQETWIFEAHFGSNYYSNGDTVLPRNLITQNITKCWDSDTSDVISLGSTAKLTTAVISQQLLTAIPSSSEKVENEYSILVTQYALTPEAYTFYQNLKQNSEQLGSIFDPLPSQVNGNLHCVTNPSQAVVGYISIGAVTSQRIFLPNTYFPDWATTPVPAGCVLAFAESGVTCCSYSFGPTGQNQVNAYINYLRGGDPDPLIPLNPLGPPGSPPLGYTATTRACADCTIRGTNVQPGFWQYTFGRVNGQSIRERGKLISRASSAPSSSTTHAQAHRIVLN